MFLCFNHNCKCSENISLFDAFSVSSMNGCKSWQRRVNQSMCLVVCLSALRLGFLVIWKSEWNYLKAVSVEIGRENPCHCHDVIYCTFLFLQMELPFYSKFLLIAAYLASYNPAHTDRRFFMKHHGKQRKTQAMIKVLGTAHAVGCWWLLHEIDFHIHISIYTHHICIPHAEKGCRCMLQVQ